MSTRLRYGVPALLVIGVVLAGLALTGGLGGLGLGPGGPGASGPNGASGATSSQGADGSFPIDPTLAPTPTPRPEVGGTELYGYLPYWEMTDGVVEHLRSDHLSTIALFSVSARRNGVLNTGPVGYSRITGPIGRQIIAEAHARDARVELVFTSFGAEKNGVFFGRIPRGGGAPASPAPAASGVQVPTDTPTAPPPWQRTVGELVDLAVDLDVDGINVDVELLDEQDRGGYGEFLAALRSRLVEAIPRARLSVATEAGPRGVGNAAKAVEAGVDRVFLMGYDYHWSGSSPGATSPIDRHDGIYDLRWSIEQYVGVGVPRDRILLGLPLYGMSWHMNGPDRTSYVLERGQTWIPNRHLSVVLDPAFSPGRDPFEVAEFFIEPADPGFRITYFDSPATLRTKLAFARDQGLAGGGFWAIGYERGLPGFLALMADFREGRVDRSEAPTGTLVP